MEPEPNQRIMADEEDLIPCIYGWYEIQHDATNPDIPCPVSSVFNLSALTPLLYRVWEQHLHLWRLRRNVAKERLLLLQHREKSVEGDQNSWHASLSSGQTRCRCSFMIYLYLRWLWWVQPSERFLWVQHRLQFLARSALQWARSTPNSSPLSLRSSLWRFALHLWRLWWSLQERFPSLQLHY